MKHGDQPAQKRVRWTAIDLRHALHRALEKQGRKIAHQLVVRYSNAHEHGIITDDDLEIWFIGRAGQRKNASRLFDVKRDEPLANIVCKIVLLTDE